MIEQLFASGSTSKYVRIGNGYVPAQPARLRAAVSRANGPETWGRHLARRTYAVAATVRSLARLELADGALREQLGELFGCEVWVSVHLGPPRANRKPVVLAHDGDNRVVGVAKLGFSTLTSALTRHEAVALLELAELDSPELRLPRTVATGPWGDGVLLVQSAVAFPGRHRVPDPVSRTAAERLIVGPPSQEFAAYLTGLLTRLYDLPGSTDDLLRAFDRAAAALPDRSIATGRWHGDWSPQNIVRTSTGVGAWDFERFGYAVPCGFDALHFRLQTLLRAGTAPGRRLLAEAPSIVRPWQSVGPDAARALGMLLLLEIAARYLGDGQDQPVTHWITDAEAAMAS